jgi:hypothetical protein
LVVWGFRLAAISLKSATHLKNDFKLTLKIIWFVEDSVMRRAFFTQLVDNVVRAGVLLRRSMVWLHIAIIKTAEKAKAQ